VLPRRLRVACAQPLFVKVSKIIACIDCDLLRFVRDEQPTEAQLLAWLGPPGAAGRYHTLRKAGLILMRDGRTYLSSRHLSESGRGFRYYNQLWDIDHGTIYTF